MKKYAGVCFAILLMATLAVPSVNAQTPAENQAKITQLLATIASLQAQLNALRGSTLTCTAFGRNLAVGATGIDVLKLQQFLNQDPTTRVSASGAGAPGLETQYYGPATAAAVSKFQVKYRAEILTPNGLANGTGYFGPSTRAKVNALCTVVLPPVTPPTTPPVNPPNNNDDELEGGEARLLNFMGDEGDDSNLEEGQDNASVANFEFDVEDGDVEVDRIDLVFDGEGNTEEDPWNVFDEISITVDGDEVGSIDAQDEDLWEENAPYDGSHTIRISDLDWIVREGETAEFSVEVTVASSVDGADSDMANWTVFVDEDGIRAVDSDDAFHYIGEDGSIDDLADVEHEVAFDIDEEGGEDELVVKASSDDIEEMTLQVDRDDASNWLSVFIFTLDADDSSNDIEVSELQLDVDVSDAETYNAIVRDARLVIDGEEYADVTVTNGGTDTATLMFDLDPAVVVDAGEMVDVELELEFKALSESDEGTTVRASVSSAQADLIEAQGSDDLSSSQISGSATGETHTLRTGGTNFNDVETSSVLKTNTNSTTDDDEGEFTIEFDVTAFEQDLYINKTAVRGTAEGTSGVNFVIENNSGDTTLDGSVSAVNLDSNADSVGGQYRVIEGQTETFTLTVEYDPATSGFYNLQLYSFNYNDTASNPDVYQRALPESTYETDPLSI